MEFQHKTELSLQTIGANIRRWQEFRELSGENLAHAIGLEKSQISKIENGNSPELSFHMLEKIAKALKLTLAHLLYSNPQSIINLTESPNSNGINYGTQNNLDENLVNELRQQLRVKDDQIKFLQSQFVTK